MDRVALLPLALLLALGLLWGGTTSIAKYVSINGVPALGYALWVSLGSGVLLALACRASGRSLPLAGAYLRYYVVCGLLGSAIPTTNMFIVLQGIPAGLMAVVIATAPLLTYLFTWLVGVEPFMARRAFGIGLGFAGALLIVIPNTSLPDPKMAPLVGLAFLTPALYALSSVYASRARPRDSDSLALAAGMMCAAGLVLLPVVAASGSFYLPGPRLELVDGLVLAHVLVAAIAFQLYFTLLHVAGPVYFSQVGYLVTLAGVGFGMLVFDEVHSIWIWLALALIFAGVTVVNRARLPSQSKL